MANQKHLDLLKQGVDIWNMWREQHQEAMPDLGGLDRTDFSGIDLGGVNLKGADLGLVNLREADLTNADLSGAYLSGADLSRADLSGANLSRADLSEASLYETNLSKADFSGANLNRSSFGGRDLRGLDFSGADLRGANLRGADLRGVNLARADLRGAELSAKISHQENLELMDLNPWDLEEMNFNSADLRDADLKDARLEEVDLSGVNLSHADLRKAKLSEANLSHADFTDADLSGADLSRTNLVKTNLTRATLTNCSVYGIAVWDVQLQGAKQDNLLITPPNQPTITIDNLKVAQFIYLLLNNQEIRDVIDTITSKVVLILGRFTLERKVILDTLRGGLREQNYMPVLFDFEKPASQTMAETIRTLAHLARFIIVDITDPRSVPAELAIIVPYCVVPVQPLLEVPSVALEEDVTGKHVVEVNAVRDKEYALFRSLLCYSWVLPVVHYQNTIELLTSLKERVIDPAEQKAKELARQK